MTQEIKLSGLAAIPDDYQSPDGQLDASLNLINEDGHLRPLFQPKAILDVDHNINYNPQVVFVHTTSAFKHYIVKTDSNVVYWMNSNTDPNNPSATFIYDFGQHTILSFNAVGNTLCVLCEDGIHYILWKGNTYKYLGNHLPELPLTFSLEAKAVLGNQFRVNIGLIPDRFKPSSGESIYFKDWPSYGEAKINEVSNNVLGPVNKFISDNATHAGRFIFPFFVRYAFRLYDGSLTMHSAPILMVTTSWCSPQAFITNWEETTIENEEFITDVDVRIGALVHQLSYKVRDNAFKTELQNWSDIVKSVDIFISAPIYTYNQAGKVEGWCELNKRAKGYTLSRIKKSDSLASSSYWPSNYDQTEDYCKWWVTPHIIDNYNVDERGKEELILPHFSDDAVKTAISDCGNFYFLKAINIDDIAQDNTSQRTIIDIPEDYLSSLTSREVMSDDYDSHDLLIPQRSHTFNSRINLFGLSKVLANPICPSAYVCWTNNSFSDENDSDTWVDNGASYYHLFVHIKQDGREIIVAYNSSDNLKLGSREDFPFIYFYYHNPNAYKLTLVAYNNRDLTDTPRVYSLPLEQHNLLNGAFFFQGWNPFVPVALTAIPTPSSNRTIPLPNKLYASEVNNPFFFPVTGINTIGTGTINGIATVTEPLSQGQFGYADIYVFCSDGIWVAQINQQGKITNINPVNKDVCTNPQSITQLGSSVLYVTQRGIMQLYGRNVECISDVIANEHPFNHLTNLPKLDSLNTNLPTIAPFSDFLSNCRMLYDYIHQRIIVYNSSVSREVAGSRVEQGAYNPETGMYDINRIINSYKYSRQYNYAYVFSLRSKLWGMMQTDLLSSLNSYPEALAMAGTVSSAGIESDTPAFSSLNLVSFDSPVTTNPVDGIAITRPIKFGSPDTLKSVYELIQRGVFNRGDVKTILYGSRDLEHWYLIASSTSHAIRGLRGTPYKYFRLVAVSSLADNQSLAGTTFVVEPRHIHQLH